MHAQRTTGLALIEYAGYLLSYLLFTTIMFLILTFAGKLPASWSYFHIVAITASIVLLAKLTRWMLK